jgi:hypothetical protein
VPLGYRSNTLCYVPHLDELTTAVLSSLLTVALLGCGNWLRMRLVSKCTYTSLPVDGPRP